LAAFVALVALAALAAVAARLANPALVAEPARSAAAAESARNAEGTCPSVDSSICLPLTAFAARSDPLSAATSALRSDPSLMSVPDSEPFLTFLPVITIAAIEVPPRATKSASRATSMLGEGRRRTRRMDTPRVARLSSGAHPPSSTGADRSTFSCEGQRTTSERSVRS
jgi:hypothetical protein